MSVADTIKNVLESGKGNPEHTHMFSGHHCTEREFTACKIRWGDTFEPARENIEQYLKQLRGIDDTPSRANEATANIPKPAEPQVATSVEATLAQRGSRYGDFTDHARLCQDIKDVICQSITTDEHGRKVHGWLKLSPVQKQALEVITDKIARILTGDPNYDDNWHDIQGYAKLVEDRLPKKESK